MSFVLKYKIQQQDHKSMESLAKSQISTNQSNLKRCVKKQKVYNETDQQCNQNRFKRQRPTTLQKLQVQKQKVRKKVAKKEQQSQQNSSEQDTQSQSEQKKVEVKKKKERQMSKQFKQNQNQRNGYHNKFKHNKKNSIQQKKSNQIEKKTNSSQQKKESVRKSQQKKIKASKQKQKQKQESINEIMQQYAKISRKKKRKSNFYLDRLDSLKWGEPVGRGSKKQRQKLEQRQKQERQRQKERKKKMKQMIKQLCQPFNKNVDKQTKIQQVEIFGSNKQTKNKQIQMSEGQNEIKLQSQKFYQNENQKTCNEILCQNKSSKCKIQDLNGNLNQSDSQSTPLHLNTQKLSILKNRSYLKNILQKLLNLIEVNNSQRKCFSQKQRAIIIRQLLRENKYNQLFKNNKLLAESILKYMYSVKNKEFQIQIATINTDLKFIWCELDKFISNVEAENEGYSASGLVLCKNVDESEKADAQFFYVSQYLYQLADNTLLNQWSKDEQNTLVDLYNQIPLQQLKTKLNQKYRPNKKWQIQSQLKLKINQLTLKGLAMLYDLTKPIVLRDQQSSASTVNVIQISLEKYLRINRSCHLGIFTNYFGLILRLIELDEEKFYNVKKKLLTLQFKSSKNEISEAVKAINNFIKFEKLHMQQSNSNQLNMKQNCQKQNQEEISQVPKI